MLRIVRDVAKGYPHHITQRGNYRQPVFMEDEDVMNNTENVLISIVDFIRKYEKEHTP